MSAATRKVARFGLFEADIERRVLTRAGLRVRLQDQPFEILALLLDRPHQIVTREEIQQKLWPADTFVAFDDGLNTAIKKLRVALGDSADNPAFIETVPRRGYRFLAAPTFVDLAPLESSPPEAPALPGIRRATAPVVGSNATSTLNRKPWYTQPVWAAGLLSLAALLALGFLLLRGNANRVVGGRSTEAMAATSMRRLATSTFRLATIGSCGLPTR